MKQNLTLHFTLIITLITSIVFAQDYNDFLVDDNNTKIFCKITQIKNGKVKYRLSGKSYSTIENITKFSDVSFANPDVIKNPLDIKIEEPESGYAHVYFYCTETVYQVHYNGEKLIKISTGSYYLHKVKAKETHKYSSHGNSIEILAENQKTYLIRATQTNDVESNLFMANGGNNFGSGLPIVPKLILDNRKTSEYALLSMKKQAKE